MTVAFAPVAFLASATVLKTGNPGDASGERSRALRTQLLHRTQVRAATLLRRDAADHLRAIRDGLQCLG